MLTCAGCSKLARCGDAPKDMTITTHTCDSWETTSYDILRARGNTYRTFGPIARQGFTKEKRKALMLPADIIASVENGEVQNIESLRSNDSVQPSQLMLCAAKLTGDAAGIAAQLKEARTNEERKEILVGILVAKAVIAQERAQAEPEVEAEPEPKTKRRRASRKKKAPEPETSQVSEIEAAKAKEAAGTLDEAPATAARVDDKLVSKVLETQDALMAQVISLSKALETASERIEELSTRVSQLSAQVGTLDSKADMQRDAFCGFEIELIGSGTINSTPFADSTAGWDRA